MKDLYQKEHFFSHPKGKIAIFYPSYWVGTVHFLWDAARLLNENGYCVEFYFKHNPTDPIPDIAGMEIYIEDNQPAIFRGRGTKLPRWWLIKRGNNIYASVMSSIHNPFFRKKLLNRHRRLPYTCFIGIDQEGLNEARKYADYLNIPYIYWSFELAFLDEVKTKKEYEIKLIEIKDSRNAAFIIIQDEWRANALVVENGLNPSKVHLVPNAPRGKARRSKNYALQKKLGISLNKKIVLYAGHLGWWSMTREVITAASSWPEEYMLLIQSRSRLNSKEFEEIKSYSNPNKVLISTNPLNLVNYRELVDSADMGLALYNPCSGGQGKVLLKNLKILGYSSGKLADYLWCGLPVIVNKDIIGPAELINSFDCGVCVSTPQQIKEAIENIIKDYDRYVINTINCFNEKLELEKYFVPVIDSFNKLAAPK